VALSTPTGPHIVPVNYSVVDDALVVRTSPYSLLGTYGPDSMLAFEIDAFDHERQRGWSVVARGRGEVVSDPAELDHIRSTWEPRPWAAGSRSLYLRLRWSELSGRRLGTAWDLEGSMPVRRVV
jgi:nitroimidazol reductase NimA-like FMN-containing flavoprotein (pyridoxamine 5'-phosphate oxidase superfamily)